MVKRGLCGGRRKIGLFHFHFSPFCPFFQWQLIFIVRNLSLRTLIIAFTDTVGFQLSSCHFPQMSSTLSSLPAKGSP